MARISRLRPLRSCDDPKDCLKRATARAFIFMMLGWAKQQRPNKQRAGIEVGYAPNNQQEMWFTMGLFNVSIYTPTTEDEMLRK